MYWNYFLTSGIFRDRPWLLFAIYALVMLLVVVVVGIVLRTACVIFNRVRPEAHLADTALRIPTLGETMSISFAVLVVWHAIMIYFHSMVVNLVTLSLGESPGFLYGRHPDPYLNFLIELYKLPLGILGIAITLRLLLGTTFVRAMAVTVIYGALTTALLFILLSIKILLAN